jgi:amino acid adenylation domain-containing protein
VSETIEECFQLSPQQEQLWLREPDGPAGRVQATVTVTGTVNGPALQAAVRAMIARHEILRTTFARQAGIRVPVQVVRETLEPAWRSDAVTDADRLAAVAAEELEAPLDLAEGPILRAAHIAGPSGNTLLLTLSSLSADAGSAAVLAGELAHTLGGSGELVPEPLQYADFAAWQVELATSEEPEAQSARTFWQDVEAAEVPELPFSAPSPDHPVATVQVDVPVDDATASALAEQAGRYGATLETVVHAAWYAALARSTALEKLAAVYVPGERRHADLDGAVGPLSRAVPVEIELAPTATFAEVVQTLTRARAEAAIRQDYAPVAGIAGFRIGFISAPRATAASGPVAVTLDSVRDTGRELAVALACLIGAAGLRVELAFDPDVISPDTADRLARRLARVLAAVAADLGAVLGQIDVLDDDERRQLLEEWGGGPAVEPSTVLRRFAAHVAAAPARTAVTDGTTLLTYGELDARANQLAHHLRGAGVVPGATVALCARRTPNLIVGLLGILKAGAAYVPLHHEHPSARLRSQAETAAISALVTESAMLAQLPELDGPVVRLDEDQAALDAHPTGSPSLDVGRDGVAYIIYTSGSTGVPKGVAVTHANLDNYAGFIAARLGADREPLSFGAITSIATDLGNTSVFGALCSGGTLVLVDPAVAGDAGALASLFATAPVDVLKITPSHIGALLAGGDPAVLPRRWLVLGGERAPWDLVTRVRAVSEVAIVNHYGPTEATIGCCTYDVPDTPPASAPTSVPIGAPIAGARCYVLDEHRALVPVGTPGQLFIGGAGVAQGYVGQPELTTERFLDDPFAGGQMYDTGDLARWLPDGTLEFLGRADEQLKIRGYRVELGEIEAVLRKHPSVTEAVVVAAPGAGSDVRLVAYCQTSGPTDSTDLDAHLRAWVPEFMVPSAIVLLDALPQTASGKINRQALPDPATVGDTSAEYVAPSSPLEERIATIWAEVLGVERVGISDDFFALGGHSLLATQVVAQVRSEFAIDLPLHSLFIHPTVAELSAEIVGLMGDSDGAETAELMAELEGLSDDEVQRLLADETTPPEY